MKVLVALLVFCVSAYAQIFIPNCSRNELGILWPYYEDNHYFYNCLGIGQPVLVKCSSNTVFSYVYQSCTEEGSYIPPPEPENLPTEFPPTNPNPTTTTTTTTTVTTPTTPTTLPTPQTPEITAPSEDITDSSTEPPSSTPATDPPVSTTQPTEEPTVTPITIPGPPSPPATDVPIPSTPAPTPPTAELAPPNPAPTVAK